jgi:cation transport ATPase
MTRKSATVLLADMECAGSTAHTVEHALLDVPGVSRAYVNPVTEAAYVEYDADRCSEADLVAAVEAIGFHTVGAAHPRNDSPAMTSRHTMTNANRHSRLWWAFAGFVAIAAFFLLEEHRAHLLGALPYLFLLACPFMHFFHHGGHGHGGHGGHAPHDEQDHEQHATTNRSRGSW